MFFKSKNKRKGEDLNRKVEKFRKWWQDESQNISRDRSGSGKHKPFPKSSDSSFVYSDET
jgi:hypothetical protein